MTMSLVNQGLASVDGKAGKTAGKSKRKKSTNAASKKHYKSNLDITMESMALSNIINPAVEAKLDESNELLI